MAIILRRFFPSKTICPICKGDKFRPAGQSRDGLLAYRRCGYCSEIYKVPPIAEEWDDGGAWSRVIPIT